MGEFFIGAWNHLLGRIGGPLSLRFIVQPIVAAVLAIRAGVADARAGRSPYFWSILSNPSERRRLWRDGWKDISTLFLVACALDLIYQLVVHRWLYTIQALIVATVPSVIPYVLFRGPATRVAQWVVGRNKRNSG